LIFYFPDDYLNHVEKLNKFNKTTIKPKFELVIR